MSQDFSQLRHRMVQEQLVRRGIVNPSVLAAMESVPRHRFVPLSLIDHAYQDGPLPIGEGQTISQPYIVALMAQAAAIDQNSKVLEIGTGSGYAAAILSQIANAIHTIERLPELSHAAANILAELGYSNVHVHTGDGTLGFPQEAPYDAIIVTAGAPAIPESFWEQLKEGGRVVIPVGDSFSQSLLRLHKEPEGKYRQENIELVRFVPLIGKQGW